MRALKISVVTLTVLAIVLLFNSDIAIDSLNKTKPDFSLIQPNSPPIKGDPTYEEALDEREEIEEVEEEIGLVEDIPVEDKEEAVTETMIDGDIVILPPREPSIVDGTKKAVTIKERFILGAVTQYGVTNSYNGAYKKAFLSKW